MTLIIIAVLALPVGLFLFGFVQGLTQEIPKMFSKKSEPVPVQSATPPAPLPQFAIHNRIQGYFPSDN